jgi:hypothetical protein
MEPGIDGKMENLEHDHVKGKMEGKGVQRHHGLNREERNFDGWLSQHM